MIKVSVMTVSDTRTVENDESGRVLTGLLKKHGYCLSRYELVTDSPSRIRKTMLSICRGGSDILFTTGGTGLGPRDNTPAVTRSLIRKPVPGIPERIRSEGARKHPLAHLSCAEAGIRGKTLVINLPGSPRGVRESFAAILPLLEHAVRMIRGEGH